MIEKTILHTQNTVCAIQIQEDPLMTHPKLLHAHKPVSQLRMMT